MLNALPRRDVTFRWGVWVGARDRTNGAIVQHGFWHGTDPREIGGRVWYGVGGALSIAPLASQLGTLIQTQEVTLGPLAAAARDLLSGYDTRQAQAEIWLFVMDGETVIDQQRAFKGYVNGLTIEDSAVDDADNTDVSAKLSLVSAARNLSRNLAAKMSDASQRQRDPNDGFRRYSDVTDVEIRWMGEVENPHRAEERA